MEAMEWVVQQNNIMGKKSVFRKILELWVDLWWLKRVVVVESGQVGMGPIIKDEWEYQITIIMQLGFILITY